MIGFRKDANDELADARNLDAQRVGRGKGERDACRAAGGGRAHFDEGSLHAPEDDPAEPRRIGIAFEDDVANMDHEVRPRDFDRLDAKRPPQASLDAGDLRALSDHRRDAVEHDAGAGRGREQPGDAEQ